jgi:pseudouridine-5'-phosphate glycosidase
MVAADAVLSEELTSTLACGKSAVALETSVVAQGLPWPANVETARAVEAAVRESRAVPASIAVLDGIIRVGLTDAELARLAQPGECEAATRTRTRLKVPAREVQPGRPRPGALNGNHVAKASRRDIAAVIAASGTAATTVSAALWAARRFGLKPWVVATGGLGGVHHEAAHSFDISADLDDLARADGALVVCSGIKSVLDMPATLEALETRGVLVVGYGCDELPGFLTRLSGLPVEHRVDSPAQAATLVRIHRALGLPGAIVLAQPVPEEQALDPEEFDTALEAALGDARQAGIAGKMITPFLLASMRRKAGDRVVAANRALLVANARLAGAVAAALEDPVPERSPGAAFKPN